jgi:MTH538 TIR-like domain (DUF1863)
MPSLYPYRIFVSHAWDYSQEYYDLINRLNDYPNFDYRNYSVPEHDRLDTTTQLGQKLLNQMNPAQVVIILAGMYAAHSEWIQYEIDQAVRLGKPIIAVKPWGQERVPLAIQNAATVVHGWNISPIIQSIRNLS